jgi:hypothetical protein
MENMTGVVLIAVLGAALAFAFWKLKKGDFKKGGGEVGSENGNEVCEKCIDNVRRIVEKIMEFKKNKITPQEFAESVEEFRRDLKELISRAVELELGDNVVYALRDAENLLRGFSLSDDSWKKEFEEIRKILDEVQEKIDKIKVVEVKKETLPAVGVSEEKAKELEQKVAELNGLLAQIDVALIAASLKDNGLKGLAQEVDRVTLLSKDIAELLRK